MTATTIDTSATSIATSTTSPLRRMAVLGETELRLLWRNKTALFTSVLLAPVMVLATAQVFVDLEGPAFSSALLVALTGFALLLGPYYNLTTTAVARREELMLKRLTSAESTRAEVLVGMALPSFLIAFVQAVLAAIAVSIALDAPAFTNPLLAVVAIVLGAAVLSLLAFASSGRTRSVESAQLTTMPILIGASLLSGLFFPLDALPEQVQRVAELSPLAPVVELLHLAVSGFGPDGAAVAFAETFPLAVGPLAVLLVWVGIGVLATRRWMGWDVRR